jgi:hypothetical protein
MTKITQEQREAIVRKAIAERDALLAASQMSTSAGNPAEKLYESAEKSTSVGMKRYDFDWGYVGIEQRENEYGEWVRYVDALAYYSEALDEAYLHGKANAQVARAVSALPVEWPELTNRLYTRAEVQEMLHEAYAEGRKDERERCAELCESLKGGDSSYATTYYDNALDDAAAAIRSNA